MFVSPREKKIFEITKDYLLQISGSMCGVSHVLATYHICGVDPHLFNLYELPSQM
jgi:hypothetical protein